MRRLTFICHAATGAQREGRFPLPDEPILEDAGLRIPGASRPDLLFAAPEKRARETALLIAPQMSIMDGLRDWDLGAWKGKTLTQIDQCDPGGAASWLADPHARPHGGETLAELSQRVGQWLDGFPQSGSALAVTHAAVMRAAALYILQAPFAAFWRMDVEPLSRMEFRSNGRLWTLRSLNASGDI